MSKEIKINIKQCKNYKCVCGCEIFKQVFLIKIVPGLMVGSATDIKQPMDLLACNSCGELIPEHKELIKPEILN